MFSKSRIKLSEFSDLTPGIYMPIHHPVGEIELPQVQLVCFMIFISWPRVSLVFIVKKSQCGILRWVNCSYQLNVCCRGIGAIKLQYVVNLTRLILYNILTRGQDY